jgi:cysteine synthase B
MSQEKVAGLRAFGARVVVCPTAVEPDDPRSYYSVAKRLAQDTPNAFYTSQYQNQDNPGGHYKYTGPELWEETKGELDVFVAGLGTGGTLMGSSRRLKEARREIEVVAVEPLQGDPVSGLRSLDDGFVPPILDLSRLDRKLLVTNRDSVVMTRRLAAEEGIFAGVSSGGVLHVCAQLAERMESGTIVGIVCDGGWKYLSTGIWTDSLDDIEDHLDHNLTW